MDSTNGPVEPLVDISAFAASDMRVGTIVEASPFEGARRPAYVLQIDFGPLGVLKSTAQITEDHTPEGLLGKKIVAVVNLPPKQVGPHTSRCLVLGAVHGKHVGLLSVPENVPNGTRIR